LLTTHQWQAALSSGLGEIYCPGGRYRITATLRVTRAIAIRGTVSSSSPANSGTEGKCVLDHAFNGDLFNIVGVSGDINASSGYLFENLLLNQIHGNGSGSSGRAIVQIDGKTE